MIFKNTIFFKTHLILFLISGIYTHSIQCFSQNYEDSIIYELVDVYPEFPGGEIEFLKYVNQNIQWNQLSDCDYSKSKIYVRFVVEIDGELSDFEIVKGICTNDLEIVLKLFESIPNWSPGILNGKTVRSYYILPLQLCFH